MKVCLIPLNPIVGDFAGNLALAEAALNDVASTGSDLILFPELALVGYPPQDLLLRQGFGPAARAQLEEFRKRIGKIEGLRKATVVVGTALDSPEGCLEPMVNCAAIIQGDELQFRAKTLIPHYDIFHERRYFESATNLDASWHGPISVANKQVGVLICEDAWKDTVKYGRHLYRNDPAADLVKSGADLLVNLSASPFSSTKMAARREAMQAVAKATARPLLYVNQLGANDEIVFDGDAFAIDGRGDIAAAKPGFAADPLILELSEAAISVCSGGGDADKLPVSAAAENMRTPDGAVVDIAAIYRALCLGIRDYARKNGFSRAILGLSGGLDSAVVASLAADALGPENLSVYSLPGKYSSSHSISDAEALAANLGCRIHNFPIKFLQGTLQMQLKPFFGDKAADVTEENLQSRLRGLVLMAMANKHGALLLTTGNKSELAVGYATLYGDMCGALSPIGDLFKTQVYALARFLNRDGERIPQNTLDKPPSAELRPEQTDQDSLPPYEVLDHMLYYLVEREFSYAETREALQKDGLKVSDEDLRSIERKMWGNEFKRHQYAPILRASDKAFGIGRRYPITRGIPEFSP